MRLLVVSWWMPYPPDNGTRQRAFNLIRHLSRRHEITLLTFGQPNSPDEVAPLREMCARVEVVAPRTPDPGRLALHGLLSPIPRYYLQTTSVEMTALVDANAARHDVVVALTCGAALHAAGACGRTPSVLEEIEVGVLREQYTREQAVVRRLRHGLTWWKFRQFVRSLSRRFDRSTVVSDQELEFLRGMGCDVSRISVIPNGVNVTDEPLARAKTSRLIYPGSVMYSANLDAVRFFVEHVFTIVRRSMPQLTFTVTGATDGVNLGGLDRIDGVTFTGRLPDVDSLIAESAVCVVPLRIGGGTRLKVLHAMALGTVVVSTSKGVEGLDLEAGRHVLVADSPEEFATAIQRVVTDDTLSRALTREAYELVRRQYAWGPIGDRLERVIFTAVDAHRPRPAAGV